MTKQALVVETEVVPTDHRPRYLSPSSISTFQQCPLRYRWSRIDKLPEPATEAQALGSMTHEILEELMLLPHAERTMTTARSILLRLWSEKWCAEAEALRLGDYDRHLFRWQVWRCVENYFALEDPATVTLSGVETRLEATIHDVPVLGILDRWSENPDGSATISDYKTGKVSKKPYDADKRLQLMVYVDLHEAINGSSVHSAELIYLKGKGTRVAYDPTPEERGRARETLVSTWAGVQEACDTGLFEARKTRLCDWCAYKGSCPAWRK